MGDDDGDDDAELLLAWRAGDQRAGQRLVQRHYKNVRRFFASKIGDSCNDLVQETFTACVASRDRIESSFRGYLFGVAYRVLKAHLRRRYHVTEELDSHSLHDVAPGPSTILRGSEERQLLLKALRRIPILLQTAVELSYWEDLDSTEIAKILGIPASTIRSRLKRARTLLIEALEKETESKELIESTIDGLERWAEELRQELDRSPKPDEEEPDDDEPDDDEPDDDESDDEPPGSESPT